MNTDTQYTIAWEWLAAYISGNANAGEKEQVDEWRKLSPENEELFAKAQKIWELSHGANVAAVNIDNAWQKVNKKANISVEAKSIPLFSNATKWVLRIAAILVVGVFSYFAYNQFFAVKQFQAGGEMMQVALSDGSKVDLNRNSKLSYTSAFNDKTREVHLEGEAFFSVSKNPNKPFIIKTANAEIKVLGTSFNVTNCSNGDVEVSVKTGIVSVTSYANKQNVLLQKQEVVRLSLRSGKLIKSTTDNENYLSWKTKRFVFKETALSEVLPLIENAYNVKIDVSKQQLLGLKLTATYENLDANAVMQTIGKTFGLVSTKNEMGYLIDDSVSMNR